MSAVPEAPPRADAAWARQAERSNASMLRLMRWIAVALGRRPASVVLHPIALYFLLSGGAAARASTAYLARALGRPPRWRERYAHIHQFATSILDRVYLLRGDFDLFEVDVVGAEHLDHVLQAGRGAFLVGAHLGSFEALRALGEERRGLDVAMLMYEQQSRRLEETLRAIAPEARQKIIGLGRMEAMLELRDWLDAGGVAGLLADRTLHGAGQGRRSRTHWIDFLGKPAAFSDGAFRLAALLRRPVVFMAGLSVGDARYQLRFAPLADFSAPASRDDTELAVQQALLRYVRMLESHCRETPRNWYNFFDFWAGSPGPQDTVHASAPPS